MAKNAALPTRGSLEGAHIATRLAIKALDDGSTNLIPADLAERMLAVRNELTLLSVRLERLAKETPESNEWQVTRDCCTSGNCFECTKRTPHGTPVRVVQFGPTTHAKALEVSRNWKAYNAAVETV